MGSGHPKRWAFKHGAFYYQVPKQDRHLWEGKSWFRLGKTEAEAFQTWFARIHHPGKLERMSEIFDAYYLDEVSKLAESTQESYRFYLAPLRVSFGAMRPADIQPIHAYRYLDGRPPVAGNRELSVLSRALTFAVRKGIVDRNVLRGQVDRNSERPRKRLPSAPELESFLVGASDTLRHYVALKRLTGLRRGQLLALKWSDWDGQKLSVSASKGGRDVHYHGVALEKVVDAILRRGEYLFVTRDGRGYSPNGFSSIFKRHMANYVNKGGDRFNEHDIRAFVASQAETLEHAQALLGHQDSRTTNRVYRRGPVKVEVLSGG